MFILCNYMFEWLHSSCSWSGWVFFIGIGLRTCPCQTYVWVKICQWLLQLAKYGCLRTMSTRSTLPTHNHLLTNDATPFFPNNSFKTAFNTWRWRWRCFKMFKTKQQTTNDANLHQVTSVNLQQIILRHCFGAALSDGVDRHKSRCCALAYVWKD